MSLKAIDRDWAALAQEGLTLETPMPEGFVYVGKGMNGLRDAFGSLAGLDEEELEAEWDTEIFLMGESKTWLYAVRVGNWEKVTGLNYTQTISAPSSNKKVATEYFNGIYNTLRIKFGEKIETKNDLRFSQLKFLQLDGNLLSAEEVSGEGFEIVPLSVFVARLESLPDKPKFIVEIVNGVNVTVDGKGITIGCKSLSHEDFQKIKTAVDQKRETKTVKTERGMAVEIGNDVISGDELTFSFSDFDQIHELVKQVGKLS